MKTKSLRLDVEELEVTSFEAGRAAPEPEQAFRTPESTCLFTQCQWTE